MNSVRFQHNLVSKS